ncbi:MAG: ABC transporter substrate-binding protein [Frankiales bacterium]|nr:ABC transporter substrate-binding protein [Frankiales bacterium]
MRNAYKIGALAIAGSLALAACGSSTSNGSSSGGGGGGGKTVTISTDLPLQGSSKDASDATNQAIELYLDQIGYKAGDYTIELKKYDDSTAAAGKWDQAQCTKNAQDHVANTAEVAVMGTYNSGCAQIQIPILNQDPSGPMLMVSQANTYPGLTKSWAPGDPDKYYPTGKRNYARVVTTDDNQGRAAAQFMAKDLGVKKCYVLNDNETYGQGIAKAFADEAAKQGITVLGNDPWDAKQPNYTALFEKIKSQSPDCIYLGGIFDNNGGQLIKDKVSVLGDNTKVAMMGPDGFTGYPELNKLPEGQGMYLSFPGLTNTDLRAQGGAAAKLLDDYKAKYGSDPASSYALYGVAAVQVILQAIQQSDGTRASVTNQVFSGSGITIPADVSAIGKEIKIDPTTGDVNLVDLTIEQIKNNEETTLKAWPVS